MHLYNHFYCIATNMETNKTFHARKIPEFMRKVLLEGGLVEYYKNIINFYGSKVKTFTFLMAFTYRFYICRFEY